MRMIKVGCTYKTKNFGYLVVRSINSSLDVEVEFVETGYKCNASVSNILNGSVKDKIMPYVFGVGFIGDGLHRSSINGVETKSYRRWHSMLKRCYSDKEHIKNPSYIGCKVCDEWHNFQVFAEWFSKNNIEGFDIDKDIKSGFKTGKVYSPEFCSFVPSCENMKHAHSRTFSLVNASGMVFKGENVREFSRGNGLDHSCLVKVIKGKRKTHKGWSLYSG